MALGWMCVRVLLATCCGDEGMSIDHIVLAAVEVRRSDGAVELLSELKVYPAIRR